MSRKIAIVIPAYNEEKHIATLLEKVKKFGDIVIVVDDGSRDRTSSLCQQFQQGENDIFCLRHRVNLGKGAALKTGCLAAKKLGAEIIVTIDGDGQHPSNIIPEVVQYLLNNKLDIVFTFRQGGDKMPLIRHLGNGALNFVAKTLFRLKLRDIWCGFRAFRTECLEKISWQKCDYSGEIQMALQAARQRLSYGEYLIPTIYNDRFKGVHILHGLKVLFQMFIWRFTL